MKRQQIDLTDNELYYLCESIKSHLNKRNSYFSKKSAKIYNSMVKKIVENGMSRKNKQKILGPIVDFEED